jgi:ABC-type microcin C transport system duplicated ATPase subunit YejF
MNRAIGVDPASHHVTGIMENDVSISELILRPFARRIHVVSVDDLRGFDPQFEIAQIVRSGLRARRDANKSAVRRRLRRTHESLG